jgi:hypothetical protein
MIYYDIMNSIKLYFLVIMLQTLKTEALELIQDVAADVT